MRRIKIFLASSSELEQDRSDFEILIGRKNKDWIDGGTFLELVVWEDFLDAMSKTRLQDEYNNAIRECDIFVMLFCTKVGKYTGEEFETAFGQFQATQKPLIYTYFKDAPISTGSANKADLNSLWAFQEKLRELGHFQTTYKNTDALKFQFSRQLDKLVASLRKGGASGGVPDRNVDSANSESSDLNPATAWHAFTEDTIQRDPGLPIAPIEPAAENLIKRVGTFSTEQKGSCSVEALRAYRACIMHSQLTFGLLEYLSEQDKADDTEIVEWIKARSDLNLSEAQRRRVLFSLLKAEILSIGVKHVKITKLGLLIYENLIHVEEDCDPVPGELEAYRMLLKDMNFVPKILNLLYKEAQNKMSRNALRKIVRAEWEPAELTRSQAEVAFAKVLKRLLRAGVIDEEKGESILLTHRGHAMCHDLFALQRGG